MRKVEGFMEKVEVAIQRGENPKETVKSTLQLLGGLGKIMMK